MPNSQIRLSLNGFGDFIEADSLAKRKKALRTFKNKSAGEAKGRSGYYGPALNAIRRSIRNGTPISDQIETVTLGCTSPKCTTQQNEAKVVSNMRVLSTFSRTFSASSIKPYKGKQMVFSPTEEIVITARPDIIAVIDGELTLVKVGARKAPRQPDTVVLMLRIMRHAAEAAGLSVSSERILFLETLSGKIVSTQAPIAGLDEEVAGLCQPIFQTWEALP